MSLTQDLALDMAEGRTSRLPRLTAAATPEYARDLLAALYRLRDAAFQERSDAGAVSLSELIAMSSVIAEIESAIVDARAWLSRMARRGGRGLHLAHQATGAQRVAQVIA